MIAATSACSWCERGGPPAATRVQAAASLPQLKFIKSIAPTCAYLGHLPHPQAQIHRVEKAFQLGRIRSALLHPAKLLAHQPGAAQRRPHTARSQLPASAPRHTSHTPTSFAAPLAHHRSVSSIPRAPKQLLEHASHTTTAAPSPRNPLQPNPPQPTLSKSGIPTWSCALHPRLVI